MATTPDAQALLVQGLQLRQADPRALLPFAEGLQGCAEADARLLAYAALFTTWAQLACGDRPAAAQALVQARAHLANTDDLDGHTLLRGIEAGLMLRDARLDDALAATRAALALPETALSPWVRFIDLQRLATCYEYLRRYDDALRTYYEVVALARRIGDAGLLASALGSVGGLQSSLMNLVDALPLCDEAWALCAGTGWHGVVHLAGINRMVVLSGLGRHAEAVAMADRMLADEAHFPAHHRHMRQCLCAMTLARAQAFERAQHLLDQASAEQPGIAFNRAEWVWIQASIHNRLGRAPQARALVETYLERCRDSLMASEFPVDRAELFAEAAQACELLGDHAAALRHERMAGAAREQASTQAAHARRLTLQIDHDLDAAHRERDAAMRDGERATREQQRLAELNLALEAANVAKTRFLAAASHDLRQPVQALAMYMAALQAERSAPVRTDLMARMNQSLQALGGMFDVLLDVSRLDAGLVPVRAAPLRLADLLRRLVHEHALPVQQRGLALRLHLPRDAADATTLSDAVLLEACLRNLLGNAIKYTERGGVVLRLRAAPALNGWRVEVRDTGIGIDAAAQALVFQEFFQIGNEERDRSKGLGLGLSIVQRTAALLRHPLGLRSRPGQGSCFHIELPRIDATDAPEPAPSANAVPWAMGLVVIDDDAAVRDSLAALLQRWGHAVVQGDDATSALESWRQLGCPALGAAIVDLRLRQGRTGLDAIAELRRYVSAGLPALVMTGDISADRLRLLADAGQPWLPKPLMPLRLRSWLQGLLPG